MTSEVVDVAVIGAGQAGLAVSHELTELAVDHIVLERSRVAETWRRRWDSFCLVTPNWTVQLPGGGYRGDQPDGFLDRDDIVAHLERYADSFGAPVREGVAVTSLDSAPGSGFRLATSAGELRADMVVLCTGAYQQPHRPPAASTVPPRIPMIDAEEYTNPAALPPGKILVVGSGQTGCQVAEELHEAGRDVWLACGRAPWAPRRIGDRDLFRWLLETPFMDMTLADLPSPLARLGANPQATGHHNGHDLNYRTLRSLGVTLVGRLLGADGDRIRFAPDLAESVAFGDDRYRELCNLILTSCTTRGVRPPELPEPPGFDATAAEQLDLKEFGAVIFTSGFRPDYTSWVGFPDAFDELGFPIQVDGASTVVPGLFFAGVHFMRKRKSSLLLGVGEDAAVVARRISERRSGRSGTQ